MTDTDRIEKTRILRAPRARVWRALSVPAELGTWFGMRLDAERFEPGVIARGRITIPEYAHVVCELLVERVEPERLLSWRWHPYAVERGRDYSSEPRTLVELVLDEVPGGTRLTVVESGFDALPLARRAEAFRMNEGGWAAQLDNIARHVEV